MSETKQQDIVEVITKARKSYNGMEERNLSNPLTFMLQDHAMPIELKNYADALKRLGEIDENRLDAQNPNIEIPQIKQLTAKLIQSCGNKLNRYEIRCLETVLVSKIARVSLDNEELKRHIEDTINNHIIANC